MTTAARPVAVFGAVALVLGCSSTHEPPEPAPTLMGEQLDCAWVTSDNCWDTTVAAAASCVPPSDVNGVLSDDNASCSFEAGQGVTFEQPLVLPFPDAAAPGWDFVLTKDGQDCLSYRFDNAAHSIRLTVKGMTYTQEVVDGGLEVICPDGSQYQAPDRNSWPSCGTTDMPGNYWGSGATSVSFGLFEGSETLDVFSCAR